MIKKLLATVLGVALLGATSAAYAASPPEPYSAPDPVYAPYHDHASVTYDSNGHIESSSAQKGHSDQ